MNKDLHRTTCDCKECQLPCQHIPGFLVPTDIPAIGEYLGITYEQLKEKLEASPGAKVLRRAGRKWFTFRIHTVRPKRNDKGHCVFWDQDTGHCQIHPVSPYGCRYTKYCDRSRKAEKEGELISRFGLVQCQASPIYQRLWEILKKRYGLGPAPEVLRKRMNEPGICIEVKGDTERK